MAKDQEKINQICEMAKEGKSITEIAKHFECSKSYISKVTSANNLKRRQAIPSDETIIASYKNTSSTNKTAKELAINQKTVIKVLHRNNVTLDGLTHYRQNAEKYSRDTQKQIMLEYDSGTSTTELAKKHGGSVNTIIEAIRRTGGEIRSSRKPKMHCVNCNSTNITQSECLECLDCHSTKIKFA